jgi:hypothetical protein
MSAGEQTPRPVYVKVTKWPAQVAMWFFFAFLAWLIGGHPGAC